MAKEAQKKMRTIKGKSYSRVYGPESSSKDRKIFPHFDIDLEYLPEARKWQNGNTYEVVLRLKQRSIREDERGGNVGFDVVGIKAQKNPIDKGKSASKKVDRRYTGSEGTPEDA